MDIIINGTNIGTTWVSCIPTHDASHEQWWGDDKNTILKQSRQEVFSTRVWDVHEQMVGAPSYFKWKNKTLNKMYLLCKWKTCTEKNKSERDWTEPVVFKNYRVLIGYFLNNCSNLTVEMKGQRSTPDNKECSGEKDDKERSALFLPPSLKTQSIMWNYVTSIFNHHFYFLSDVEGISRPA